MRFARLVLLGCVLMASVTLAQTQVQIARYPLPADVTYPEGIALDAAGGTFYTASAETGTVVRVQLSTRQSATVATGALLPADPFPKSLGMKVDAAGRLWISGGRTGRMAVMDPANGRILKQFDTGKPGASVINDVALAGSHAYFTDTMGPTVWRIPFKGAEIGNLEPWLDFTGTAVQYGEFPNMNGIAATPDGRHLLVVQMNKGLLFRIDVADKRVTAVNVGNEPLNGGDGLVLDGQTLYVVRQTEGEIVTVDMAADFGSGRVRNRFKHAALVWPATAAKSGDQLLVVSSQFNRRTGNAATRPFEIVGIPLAALRGQQR